MCRCRRCSLAGGSTTFVNNKLDFPESGNLCTESIWKCCLCDVHKIKWAKHYKIRKESGGWENIPVGGDSVARPWPLKFIFYLSQIQTEAHDGFILLMLDRQTCDVCISADMQGHHVRTARDQIHTSRYTNGLKAEIKVPAVSYKILSNKIIFHAPAHTFLPLAGVCMFSPCLCGF